VRWEDRAAEHYVYRLLDANGQALYVGMTWDLNSRLESHQAKPWAWQIARVDVTRHAGRLAAMAVEREEIVRLLPAHNVNIKRKALAGAK
jgi:predicted GIY-YIG superfamily endonuclease